MPAHPLVLASSSVTNGTLGDSYQAGTKTEETLAGQRPSPWSSSSGLFSCLAAHQESKSTATTQALWKTGGQVEAEMLKPTTFSEEFTISWKKMTSSSQPDTLTPRTTQRTTPLEEFSCQSISSSHPSLSPTNSGNSSLISMHLLNPVCNLTLEAFLQRQNHNYLVSNNNGERKRTPSQTSNQTQQHKCLHLNDALNKPHSPRKHITQISHTNTNKQIKGTQTAPTTRTTGAANEQDIPWLKPSPLRSMDHKASDRIRLWIPEGLRRSLDDKGQPTNLEEQDLERIRKVIGESYAPQTRSTYGTSLFIFHLFCNNKDIREEHRAPVEQTVLASFISTLVGTYSGSTIRNYVYGIRAWHIIHGIKWDINNNEIEMLLRAGHKLSPKEARREMKQPWTLDYLTEICRSLKQNKPKDTAVLACLTTAFWGTARLGEVTIKTPNTFDPNMHVKVSNVRYRVLDKNDLEMTVIFIPWTKVAKEKEKTYSGRNKKAASIRRALWPTT